MNLTEKLLSVQNDLRAPKTRTNNFGKYKYRSCEDILEAVKPICFKHGLLLTISDSIECVADRVYVKATANISDGESAVIVSAYAREAQDKKGMDDAQITGSASSYARKYALNGLFCIDDTQDADSTNTGKDEAVQEQYTMQQGYYVAFSTAADLEELQQMFTSSWKSAKTEAEKKAIVTAKDGRKKELSK